MSQLPIDLFHQVKFKTKRGHQAYWDIIKVLGANEQSFTMNEVYRRTKHHSASVYDYVKRLTKAKYIKIIRREKMPTGKMQHHFIVLKAVMIAPRLRRDGSESLPTLNSQMWFAMRVEKKFNARDIEAVVPKEIEVIVDGVRQFVKQDGVELSTVKRYLTALYKAGYLKIIEPHGNKQLTRYWLINDTGPLEPKIQRCKMVWDQNLNQVMGVPEVKEVAA
ncbi:MAG: hypothetical protein HRU28_00135 [Rhizobiales bacterium]|nr:hypothetical protein [Hyphomicrobiales bacterium]